MTFPLQLNLTDLLAYLALPAAERRCTVCSLDPGLIVRLPDGRMAASPVDMERYPLTFRTLGGDEVVLDDSAQVELLATVDDVEDLAMTVLTALLVEPAA
jgi:hypothetical protein